MAKTKRWHLVAAAILFVTVLIGACFALALPVSEMWQCSLNRRTLMLRNETVTLCTYIGLNGEEMLVSQLRTTDGRMIEIVLHEYIPLEKLIMDIWKVVMKFPQPPNPEWRSI